MQQALVPVDDSRLAVKIKSTSEETLIKLFERRAADHSDPAAYLRAIWKGAIRSAIVQ